MHDLRQLNNRRSDSNSGLVHLTDEACVNKGMIAINICKHPFVYSGTQSTRLLKHALPGTNLIDINTRVRNLSHVTATCDHVTLYRSCLLSDEILL